MNVFQMILQAHWTGREDRWWWDVGRMGEVAHEWAVPAARVVAVGRGVLTDSFCTR